MASPQTVRTIFVSTGLLYNGLIVLGKVSRFSIHPDNQVPGLTPSTSAGVRGQNIGNDDSRITGQV